MSSRRWRRNTLQVQTKLIIPDYKPNWTLFDLTVDTWTQNVRLLREVWSVWFAQQAEEAGGDTNPQHTLIDDQGIKWMWVVVLRCWMSETKCPTSKGKAADCSCWFLLITTTVTHGHLPSPDPNPNRAVYVLQQPCETRKVIYSTIHLFLSHFGYLTDRQSWNCFWGSNYFLWVK